MLYATINTNGLIHRGCPRDTTARQNTYICRQHMNNRITRGTQTIDNQQRRISDDTVRR
jgi:hypothetical protein